MTDDNDLVVKLLARMDIDARVRLDDENKKVFVIATGQYVSHLNWIDSWFTFVGQKGQFSFFRERLRGTGQTMH